MKRSIIFILFIGSLALFIFFLLWHAKLGMNRYFDVDEFAFLHWTYKLLQGKAPYIDFFSYMPSGFLFFLAPAFSFWRGVEPVIVARIVSFIVFCLLSFSIIILFWQVRRSLIAVVSGMILAFLPLPFDKFIEIRPDTLSVLSFILGLNAQVFWMANKGKKAIRAAFFTGLFYALSIIVLPKILPGVFIGGVFAVVWLFKHKYEKDAKRVFIGSIIGFIIPFILYGLWLISLGDIQQVLYSHIILPFEVNKIGKIFYMQPDLFFYPNGMYYGIHGVTRGLITNHVLWLTGICTGIYRLFTPYITKREKDGVLIELLIAGGFAIQIILFVSFVPLRHAQYLIPIAVFIAYYCADFVYIMTEKVEKTARILTGITKKAIYGLTFFLALSGLIYLLETFISVNKPKLSWTNENDIESMKDLFQTIPKDAYVLDLDGRVLYNPDPYYICCLPFGQHAPFVSHKFPPLRDALEKTRTEYIYQGGVKRISTLLPEDQAYIHEHFMPIKNGELLVRKK